MQSAKEAVEMDVAKRAHQTVQNLINRAQEDENFNYLNEAVYHCTVGLAILHITKNLYLLKDMKNAAASYIKVLEDEGVTLSADEAADLAASRGGIGSNGSSGTH